MLPARFSGPLAACLLGLLTSSGCSTVDSINGIAAVPAGLLVSPRKSDMQELSISRLRQDPPEVYQLGPDDVLGIYIENVIGTSEEPPPVHFPENGDRPPAIGFPIPIREDGAIALPLVDPLDVAGLTLTQTTSLIRKAYTVDKQILPPGKDRVIVTLIRRRRFRVLVIREEAGAQEGVNKRGTGSTVDLPAYENDVLHALNETGGLPGTDAKNEILIIRGQFDSAVERDRLVADINSGRLPCAGQPPLPNDPNVTRIPLRFTPEALPVFSQDDIILETGDIVMIQARDQETFLTGGVLGGAEIPLPRDKDLDVLGAIALAGGQVGTGKLVSPSGGGVGNFGGRYSSGGVGLPPTRVIIIRRVPGRGQVAACVTFLL